MRWSPVALLPPVFLLFLPAVARAPPGIDHAARDIDQGNTTKILALAQTASEIFMIDGGAGGCAGREVDLDLWVKEAGKLHAALLKVQESAAHDLVAGGLFYAWLGVFPGDIVGNSPLWKVITGQ